MLGKKRCNIYSILGAQASFRVKRAGLLVNTVNQPLVLDRTVLPGATGSPEPPTPSTPCSSITYLRLIRSATFMEYNLKTSAKALGPSDKYRIIYGPNME